MNRFRPSAAAIASDAIGRDHAMRNFLASILAVFFFLVWPGTHVMGVNVKICTGPLPADDLLNVPSQPHQEPLPGRICQIAQSPLVDYGKLPKEQWNRDRQLQMEQIERSKKWDEYGKVRRCKGSCYETYRNCIRRRWDPRSQSCQQDFNNCVRSCE